MIEKKFGNSVYTWTSLQSAMYRRKNKRHSPPRLSSLPSWLFYVILFWCCLENITIQFMVVACMDNTLDCV